VTERKLYGVTELAERVGITLDYAYALSNRGKLPRPDQTVGGGRTKLWYAETIDRWDENRRKK
jgi:predicted DNA-binding transcriptional regulator AlpA